MASSLVSVVEPSIVSLAPQLVPHSDQVLLPLPDGIRELDQYVTKSENLPLPSEAVVLSPPSPRPSLGSSSSVVPPNPVLRRDSLGDFASSGELHGETRVYNLHKAKSVLKRELFDWLDTSSLLKRAGIQTVQVTFTKCGRFALMVARSRFGQFGLRLATLDPHHRLSTYLLGVSLTLESALLHAAARMKQMEDDLDEMEKTLKHGDVIHVEHLGYSHVAIYDANDQVFYELFGDIDSGKDAFLAQANSAQSAALKFQQDLKEATELQLKSALSLFRSVPNQVLPGEAHTPATETASKSETPPYSITPSTLTISSETETIPSTSTTPSLSTSISNLIKSPQPTRLNSMSHSSATSPATTPLTHPIEFPLDQLLLPAPVVNYSMSPPLRYVHTSSAGATINSIPSTPAPSPTSPPPHVPPAFSEPVVAPPPVFEVPSPKPIVRKTIASILAHSGHLLTPSDPDALFSDIHDSHSDDEYDWHGVEGDSSEQYDVKRSLAEATRKLRNLATSSDDIGLKLLLKEDESTYFTSAEHEESIQPDDTCPAIALGFPSHSIAEVQATPKDIFLMRDPLLKKYVKYYANALPPDVVVARAKSVLGSPGWNPISRNCEHFATWAKTGRTVSTQVFELGSNTAIVGASTLQTVVTLAFFGLTILWALGKVISTNAIMEMVEMGFAWFLKFGVFGSSIIVALGMLVHWQNGRAANFDDYVLLQTTTTTTATTTTTTTAAATTNGANEVISREKTGNTDARNGKEEKLDRS